MPVNFNREAKRLFAGVHELCYSFATFISKA